MSDFKCTKVVGKLEFNCDSAAKEFKSILETNSYHDVLDLIKICMLLNANHDCGYKLTVYSSAYNNVTGVVESIYDSASFWLIEG